MTVPVPTPEEKAYRRVLWVARMDGLSVVIFAALGSLVALVMGDFTGLLTGLLIGAAGAMELRGHKALKGRDAGGMRWLIRSQLFLLTVILVYCVSRLASFDRESVMGNLTPDMASVLTEGGIDQADIVPLVRMMFFAIYGGVAIVTLLYQGGMALYYRSRTARITAFLATPPPIVVQERPLA